MIQDYFPAHLLTSSWTWIKTSDENQPGEPGLASQNILLHICFSLSLHRCTSLEGMETQGIGSTSESIVNWLKEAPYSSMRGCSRDVYVDYPT
jgi:hypothetical protein